jgi:N utilization substance protein A
MKSDFTLAFNEIAEARGLPRERVLEALKQALITAYRKDARIGNAQHVEAQIDPTGQPILLLEKEVVPSDARDLNPQTEIPLHEAQALYPNAQIGDLVMAPVQTLSKTFGRVAAQNAKQVILQQIREAEREALYQEYIERVGDITVGTVQSINRNEITIDLGRAEGVMPEKERVKNERYRPHDKIRVYIAQVTRDNRGPKIILSRSHRNMLRRLLEYEVPEIYNGLVEIKNIAREAGYRSKVAVAATQDGIDAVGACVGMKGVRIQNIVRELNNEKIDIIEYDPDPAKFISRALQPARVMRVFLEEELDSGRTATVIVLEDQLSLAIGKEGQNARLAAKLTGWKIDIKSVVEAAREGLANLDSPALRGMAHSHAALIQETGDILAKKDNNRIITPEEYTTLRRFVEVSQGLIYEEKRQATREKRELIESVRPLVPPVTFKMPLKVLELAPDIMNVIEKLGNVGELWVRFMADEEGLSNMLALGGAKEDSMEAIRYALDDLVIPEVFGEEEESPAQGLATASPAESLASASEAPAPLILEEVEPLLPIEAAPAPRERGEDESAPDYEAYMQAFEEENFEDDEDENLDRVPTKAKKSKQKRRQLVYDEDSGEMIAKRRHKRAGDEYEDFF